MVEPLASRLWRCGESVRLVSDAVPPTSPNLVIVMVTANAVITRGDNPILPNLFRCVLRILFLDGALTTAINFMISARMWSTVEPQTTPGVYPPDVSPVALFATVILRLQINAALLLVQHHACSGIAIDVF
jgi:hypothetical protein